MKFQVLLFTLALTMGFYMGTSPRERANSNYSGLIEGDKREIVCWGDSLTEGDGVSVAVIPTKDGYYNASFKSYPEILQYLTGLKTFNFGVSGATSEEIAYMQGGVSEKSSDVSDEERYDEYEEYYDEEEELYYRVYYTYDEEYGEYYVSKRVPVRDADGNEIEEEEIYNKAVADLGAKHLGDVLVLEMGSNGGWDNNYDELIDQYRAVIEHSGCGDKYIVIGDTDDPGSSLGDLEQYEFDEGEGPGETTWEAVLEKEFGKHFINMRVYLIEQGLDVCGIKETSADKELASVGCISNKLRADWTHLNSYGYYAQAYSVYERGIELGYWKKHI